MSRHVLITGGSRGIGRATAHALAERGWRVGLIARERDELERARAELSGAGHEAFAMDVCDEAAWGRLAGSLREVQGLVCAAATLDPVGPIDGCAVADFRRTLEVNVIGTLLAIRACLPGLRTTHGAVVTFSGGGATAPLPRFDAYAASKAAVVRLSENIALELAGEGVRINSVAPGFVATGIHRSTLAAGPERAGAAYFEHTRAELRRGGVPASEAAELVCLLLEHDPHAPFTGKLISAQWDPWRDREFRSRLVRERDLATLRRIDERQFATIANGAGANGTSTSRASATRAPAAGTIERSSEPPVGR
ncbi:MAG TPA: SDR family oxidoreductase [Solirubrobacteraceae bacterium]|jgi:3-oxoacyl-[acyl-carrier protein] reductase